MLVITVREGEDTYIGDPLNPIAVVRFIAITGSNKARIGIDADPKKIKVYRHAVAEQIIDEHIKTYEGGDEEGKKNAAPAQSSESLSLPVEQCATERSSD